MKNSATKIGFAVIMALSATAFAGDGHDHGVPGAIAAPKGGEIKPAVGSYFELIKGTGSVKIYAYDGKLKPLALDLVTDIEGTVKIPRGATSKVAVEKKADHFLINFDAGKSHRFELTMKFKIKGEADSVTYNVEKN